MQHSMAKIHREFNEGVQTQGVFFGGMHLQTYGLCLGIFLVAAWVGEALGTRLKLDPSSRVALRWRRWPAPPTSPNRGSACLARGRL
jgi:hypothetical protein